VFACVPNGTHQSRSAHEELTLRITSSTNQRPVTIIRRMSAATPRLNSDILPRILRRDHFLGKRQGELFIEN
jgi:hypothetical protein